MKIDDTGLHGDRSIKVKCPHCEVALSMVTHAPRWEKPPSARPDTKGSDTGIPAPESGVFQDEKGPEVLPVNTEGIWDEEIPQGAFFPAEQDAGPTLRSWMASSLKTFIWIVVSVAVVALFALIVNLTLPGPAGDRGAAGFRAPKMEHRGTSSTQ
jgi:hypothetical protein